MSRSRRALVTVAVLFCLATATRLVAQDFVTITTLAGAEKSRLLKEPRAVAIDLPSGVLFIADRNHHQIVALDPSGAATVIAGGNPGRMDGEGSTAQFNSPEGIAVDSARRVIYVADTKNHLIRRLTFDGMVNTLAGSGSEGDRDGAGTEARFQRPSGLALDRDGNLYVADSGNQKIRMVTPYGTVTTLAGTGRAGYSDGAAAEASFKEPRGVAVSASGEVYVADSKNHVIRRITHGVVSTVAGAAEHPGRADGPPNVAEFHEPSGLAFDATGNLWIADTRNHQVRRLGTDQITTTIAGDGTPGNDDGADLNRAQFHEPTGIAVAGAVFVVDSKNDSIRALFPSLSAADFIPRSGSPNGGDAVRVSGAGFVPGRTVVMFDVVPAASVAWISSTELLVITPPGLTGDAQVRVSTFAGSALFLLPFRFIAPFTALSITPGTATLDAGGTQQFTAIGVSANSTSDLTSRVSWSSSTPAVATIDGAGFARAIASGSATITATFGNLSRTATIIVRTLESLPPDPATLATPVDPTVVSDMSKSVQFLYTGPDAIQKNVQAGVIDARRVAVIRGRVVDAAGAPLGGVRVSILDRAAFGFTLTRADGMFDLAVSGGGESIVVFAKSGWITAQRRTTTPWRDYAVLDDVFLTPYDAASTVIQFGAAAMQVAQGSAVSDSDGARRATLLVPAGTAATIRMATGSTTSAASLTIRATEFSIGPNGPQRMPAALPPTSAYTYCVELSADEVVAANAQGVSFSKPLAFYVDNFLSFPVGTIVPAGYYDRVKGAWIASENGVVLKVLTTTGGTATIDVTGDGVADEFTNLGVTAEERQALAGIYQPGQTLWRAQISHFTPWDLNFSYIPPHGAMPPNQPQPTWFRGVEEPQTRCGSTIDCQNQVFGDAIPIDGTPFALRYQSDHAAGYKAGNGVEIPLSGAQLPAPLKRIDVEINIQGRSIRHSFPASPNQTYRFLWDGLDAYGRDLQGMQVARIRVGYAYDGVYASAPEIQRAFASVSGIPISTNRGTRQELVFWQDEQALVGSVDDLPLGFGGWTLDAMKTLEPASGIVHGGAAAQRTGDLQRNMIDLFAGGGTASGNGDGGFARGASFQLAWAVAAAPDGTVYVSDWTAGRIRKIQSGLISTALINVGHVNAMVAGPDDALYYAVGGEVRRWGTFTGANTAFAGAPGSTASPDDDEIPAINAVLGTVEALAFGPDRNLYVGGSRIRRIGADGIIYGVTGATTLPPDSNPEGRPARSTNVGQIAGLAVGIDGTIYFTVSLNSGRVFSIAADGVIRRFAGTGPNPGSYAGDGGPAVAAALNAPMGLAAGPDGSVYIADSGYSTIRRVLPNGIIKTATGIPFEFDGLRDGGPAAAASVFSPRRMAVAPDGALYLTDQFYMTVRRVSPPDPLANTGEYRVPSADGGTMDVFSSTGRHVRTIDTVTGVVIRQLGYDAMNRLVTITDKHGNVTTIERDGGIAAAIVSPFGKRTTLVTTAGGYLQSVANPAGETTTMTYTAGQVTSMKNARGITKTIVYDGDGRLLSERYPDGSGITLTRVGSERDATVTVESGEGRAAVHARQIDDIARDTRVDVDRDTGLQTTSLRTEAGSSTTTLPDGTVVTEAIAGDPRFATLAPLPSGSVRTPAGRTLTMSSERTVTLSNPFDPLSLRSITETRKLNGRAWKSTFTKATNLLTTLTPAGRSSTTTLNAKGDIASVQMPGFAAASLSYDPQGRVTSFQTGQRTFGVVYNPRGEVERVTDPSSRTVSFEYDAAGRVTRQTLPDTRVIEFTYDENGNLTSVAPPARPAHGFGFTSRDLMERYTPPPAVPGGATRYTYNRDRQLTSITRPDGGTITPGYDTAGRLSILTTPQGAYGYGYSAATGNLSTISAPGGGGLTYAYDGSLLTNVEWAGTVSGSVSYEYDNDFRVSNENGAAFSYDADSLLIGAGSLSLTRNPQNGLLTGTTLGSITDSYTYNEFGEVTGYAASHGATNLLAIAYGRDSIGRITSTTETFGAVAGASEGYEYDRAGRLTRVTRAGTPVAEYDYDPNSNRIAHRFEGGTASATYDQQDRLLTYDDTTYTYSANGELESRTTVGETTTFAYDALGNLRTVQIPGKRIDYVIDAQNRRIGRKVDGVLVQGWLYADQLRVIAELDGTGNVVSRFVYGSRVNAPDYLIRDGVTYRIFSDHLGSPRLVVNVADGTIAQQIEYDEFGRVVSDSNPGFQPFGFAGGLSDRDTGLVRFGARGYDSHTGRFTTKDPIFFKGGDTSLYAYAFSDPINWVDPSGLETEVIIWGGAGWGTSSLGHASTVINDTSFSFAPGGMDIRSAPRYIARQGFRWGFGLKLNLTRGQEQLLEKHFREYASEYSIPANACTNPIRTGLDDLGYDFTFGRVDPVRLGLDLMNSGKVIGVRFYPPTQPVQGSSAPWAPFPRQ
jgi:RHS repeat-associated protein